MRTACGWTADTYAKDGDRETNTRALVVQRTRRNMTALTMLEFEPPRELLSANIKSNDIVPVSEL